MTLLFNIDAMHVVLMYTVYDISLMLSTFLSNLSFHFQEEALFFIVSWTDRTQRSATPLF